MSTQSSREAYEGLNIAKLDGEILDLLEYGPLGNYRIGDILGRSQGTISGALARLRTLGLVYDTGLTERRGDSDNPENVWALGDDSVEWLTGRIESVIKHAVELEQALVDAKARRAAAVLTV